MNDEGQTSLKVLCISDKVDPLIYNSAIKERFGDIDLVLSSGDLAFSYYDFIVSSLNKPFFFVFGNHQLKELGYYKKPSSLEDRYSLPLEKLNVGGIYIDGKVKKAGSLLVAGLGGCLWYNGEENQFREWQMALKITRLIPSLLWNKLFRGRYLDIMVTHTAPFGVGDKKDLCHRGFRVFLWFMRRFKPRYLIHGHIHLYDLNAVREHTYDATTVINAYRHYVLSLEE